MAEKKLALSCEQLYEIWSSEPELLTILDFREPQTFKTSHIPGSVNLTINDLLSFFSQSKDRLIVLLSPDNLFEEINTLLKKSYYTNFIFLNDCQRWQMRNFPTAEKSITDINSNLKTNGSYMNNDIIFFQLFERESSTYTYIIGDSLTKEAAIIDPVLETLDRDLNFLEELGLRLVYILDTHIHADHITAADEIRKVTGAKTAVNAQANVDCVDIPLEDGQELKLGQKIIKAISTPGHTNSCMSFYFEGKVFTGDTLLIRGSGRTDFQQGSTDNLYHSVQEKLFKLPDSTIVYPAHDYRGFTSSTIALEKKYNPRLGLTKSLNDFKKIMSELNLPYPKKIDVALPANLKCGIKTESRFLRPQIIDGIPEVTCEDIYKNSKEIHLIDVRRPDEFNTEYFHIEGAKLVTLGADLTQYLSKLDKDKEVAFICRSGGRSGTATAESIKMGFTKSVNMAGGMIKWNEMKFPTTGEK